MNRQEAIKILKHSCDYIGLLPSEFWDSDVGIIEAIDMAIEALMQESRKVTQESTQDQISRQDALKPFCISPDGTRIPEVDCDNFPVEFSVEFIKKHLLSLPSADTEWIPCSEKLPEKEELVLVTVWNDVVIAWRNRYGGWESVEDMYEKGDVISSMPLPKPYKGGDDE